MKPLPHSHPDFEPDRSLETAIEEERDGVLRYPPEVKTLAEQRAHLEYRLEYLRLDLEAAHGHNLPSPSSHAAYQRTLDALNSLKQTDQQMN